MRRWYETVADIEVGGEILRRRRYGVIEAAQGQFRRIVLRPGPKIVSRVGMWLARGGWLRRQAGDRCLVYYNQPGRFPGFLAIPYIVATHGTRFATVCRALEVLDEIARLKRTGALLCDLSNHRISDRIMARFGWEPHLPSRWHRHFIKRFYGTYPQANGRPGPSRNPGAGRLYL